MKTFEQIQKARGRWERRHGKPATVLLLSPAQYADWRQFCQTHLKFDLTRVQPPYRVSRGMTWASSAHVEGDELRFE